jgi:hypothetical protein
MKQVRKCVFNINAEIFLSYETVHSKPAQRGTLLSFYKRASWNPKEALSDFLD